MDFKQLLVILFLGLFFLVAINMWVNPLCKDKELFANKLNKERMENIKSESYHKPKMVKIIGFKLINNVYQTMRVSDNDGIITSNNTNRNDKFIVLMNRYNPNKFIIKDSVNGMWLGPKRIFVNDFTKAIIYTNIPVKQHNPSFQDLNIDGKVYSVNKLFYINAPKNVYTFETVAQNIDMNSLTNAEKYFIGVPLIETYVDPQVVKIISIDRTHGITASSNNFFKDIPSDNTFQNLELYLNYDFSLSATDKGSEFLILTDKLDPTKFVIKNLIDNTWAQFDRYLFNFTSIEENKTIFNLEGDSLFVTVGCVNKYLFRIGGSLNVGANSGQRSIIIFKPVNKKIALSRLSKKDCLYIGYNKQSNNMPIKSETANGKPSLTNEANKGKPSLTSEANKGKPSLTNEAFGNNISSAGKEPESNQPESNQPESNQPESNQPESNQPESNQPESNQPESNQHESSSLVKRVPRSYKNTSLKSIEGSLKQVQQSGNVVCGVNSNNEAYCADKNIYTNPNWTKLNRKFKYISVNNGRLFGIDENDNVYYSGDYKRPQWKRVSGSLKQVDFDGNVVCGINSNGDLYCADNDLLNPNWRYIPQKLKHISISKGKLYGVDLHNNVYYGENYRNPNWQRVSGKLKQVSVDGNVVCGVDDANNIYCSDTGLINLDWQLMPGKLKYVSVNNKRLYGVNNDDEIFAT
jgi:hypothetical protein